MAYSSYASMPFGGSAPQQGLISTLVAALATYRAGNNKRRLLRHELESFTDRQLNDLGISRVDIEDVVWGRYRR